MPSTDVLPAAAQARFTAAEAQLYPLALVDPDEYQRVIRVVGLLAAELRTEAPDIATVLGLRAELVTRVPIIAAEAGLTIRRISARDDRRRSVGHPVPRAASGSIRDAMGRSARGRAFGGRGMD